MNMAENQKMDVMFHRSHAKLHTKYIFWTVLHTLKALLLIIFMPIDYSIAEGKTGVLTVFMGIAIGVSCFNALINLLFYCTVVRDEHAVLNLAIQCNHAVD